jgi:hypothetical protein
VSCIYVVFLSYEEPVSIRKLCAGVGASRFGTIGGSMDVDVALLITEDKEYSIVAQKLQERRGRKLKLRKERQTARGRTAPYWDLDAIITAAQAPKLTAQLQQGFAKMDLDDDKEMPELKRRRFAVTDGDAVES